jgi:hypothetical protein
MKALIHRSFVALAALMALAAVQNVVAQTIAISSASQPVQLSGTSGGNRKDANCAGSIASTPNHVVQVQEDSNLRFTLQAAGKPALLIQSASGQVFCVAADSFSNGKVEIPGRWTQGTYQVFVGDRGNGQFPYTLSIAPN